MITKDDWNDALDAWVADERERLGGPPSPEDVVAYLSGELPPADAARVRALLVYYPEFTPLLDERIEKPRQRRPAMAVRLYAVAAMLVISMLTGLLVREHRKNGMPVVHTARHELRSFPTRGGGPTYVLPAGEERYLLAVTTAMSTADEIRIARGAEVLWRASDVRAVDGTFTLSVPGRFLKPGTYTLSLHSEGSGERLTLHVEGP